MNLINFFDEINGLSSDRKEKRIRKAQRLEQLLVIFFNAIYADIKNGIFTENFGRGFYDDTLYNLLLSEMSKDVKSRTGKLEEHITLAAEEIMRTTADVIMDPETNNVLETKRDSKGRLKDSDIPQKVIDILGRNRIQTIAANESLYINNYSEQQEAVENNKQFKTWNTMRDVRVRPSHRDMDRQTIPIQVPFLVNDSIMMFPGDTSYGASPDEIIMCRCWLTYS